MGEYYDWYDKNPEESKSLTVQFTKLTKVRQIIADEKLHKQLNLLKILLNKTRKLLYSVTFTDSLNKITEHFGKSPQLNLMGQCQNLKDKTLLTNFQDNPKVKVLWVTLKPQVSVLH